MGKINRRGFLTIAGAAPLGLPLLKHAQDSAASSAIHDDTYGPWLEIRMDHIGWNLSQIREWVRPTPVMAVIKANAYGHGLVEVARFLEKQHVRFLAVGKVEEALRVRDGGVKTPILNFGPFSQGEAKQIVQSNVSQSVFDDGAWMLAETAEKFDRKAKIHIKVDTGLGRVGIPYGEALDFIEMAASKNHLIIEGIFTTFTEEPEFDAVQLKRFLDVCDAARKRGIQVGLKHAASSAAILSFPAARLDIIRPGITLYGHYPSDEEYRRRRIDLKPAMTMKTRVALVKNLRSGDSVSYHRVFKAEKEIRVATLPIGYSDGYPPQTGDKGEVLIGGKRRRAVAPVTSNHLVSEVTGTKDIKVGDEAVIVGKQGTSEITAEEVAEWAGMSVYKVVIGMNPLLPRKYMVG
ncbi:MAG: alanine racemase [bacterium]